MFKAIGVTAGWTGFAFSGFTTHTATACPEGFRDWAADGGLASTTIEEISLDFRSKASRFYVTSSTRDRGTFRS